MVSQERTTTQVMTMKRGETSLPTFSWTRRRIQTCSGVLIPREAESSGGSLRGWAELTR